MIGNSVPKKLSLPKTFHVCVYVYLLTIWILVFVSVFINEIREVSTFSVFIINFSIDFIRRYTGIIL